MGGKGLHERNPNTAKQKQSSGPFRQGGGGPDPYAQLPIQKNKNKWLRMRVLDLFRIFIIVISFLLVMLCSFLCVSILFHILLSIRVVLV